MMDQTHSQNQGYLISQILTVTRTLEVWEVMKNMVSYKLFHWLTLNGTAARGHVSD